MLALLIVKGQKLMFIIQHVSFVNILSRWCFGSLGQVWIYSLVLWKSTLFILFLFLNFNLFLLPNTCTGLTQNEIVTSTMKSCIQCEYVQYIAVCISV